MSRLPLLRQIFVATAPQLGAFSIGGAIGFPNVLLEQLKTNETSFEMDLDTSSWIGSIHGLAGIPSILMSTLMQWRGRKTTFLICCLLILLGWTLVFLATSTKSILISECFLGLGSNSLMIVSLSSLTEMLDPKFRNMFIVVFGSMHALGMSSAGVLGQYFYWKTASLFYLVPIVFTFLNALFVWPESPAWLALKERFQECESTFIWLRGNSNSAHKELSELLQANKDVKNEFTIKRYFERDFYIPTILMFVVLNMSYWTGETVVMIYAIHIINITSGNKTTASNGMIILDTLLFICHVICILLVKRYNNKSLMLVTTSCTILSMIYCSIVTYVQSIGLLDKSPLCLYGLIAFVIFINMGLTPLAFVMSLEIMPVKHRGIGGAFYIIFMCCLHTSALKAAPYLFIAIDLWGTFLLYAINGIICVIIVWIYMPETKNRTLQELEDYFNHFKFIKRVDEDVMIIKPEYS